jgi:hypothetical protein
MNHDCGDLFHRRDTPDTPGRLRTPRAHRFRGLVGISVEEERRTVERRCEDIDSRLEEPHAESYELHVADDVRPQRCVMRERRAFESGMHVTGDGAATDNRTGFEHDRPQSRFCEIEGSRETVVAAADDHDLLHRPVSPGFATPRFDQARP